MGNNYAGNFMQVYFRDVNTQKGSNWPLVDTALQV